MPAEVSHISRPLLGNLHNALAYLSQDLRVFQQGSDGLSVSGLGGGKCGIAGDEDGAHQGAVVQDLLKSSGLETTMTS